MQDPAPDAGRRARQLAGLAQGQGAAARRRLRRPRADRRGPGRGRRARARRLRRADRAQGRGRADAPRSSSASRSPSPRRSRSTRPSPTSSRRALEQIPGRAIVNSINLEAGEDKANVVVPLAVEHGAALIALTIDEVGMAKTADRKVEIAKRITELCEDHGLEREALIFDVLTFTLTTGDEEWQPSARSRRSRASAASRRSSRASRPRSASRTSPSASRPRARAVLNSRLPAPLRRGRPRPRDGQPEPHHAVRGDRRGGARARRRPRLQPPRGRAREVHRALRVPGRGGRGGEGRPDRGHGARGGPALAHPAPQEGRRRGPDRPRRREDRRGPRRSTTCCCRP